MIRSSSSSSSSSGGGGGGGGLDEETGVTGVIPLLNSTVCSTNPRSTSGILAACCSVTFSAKILHAERIKELDCGRLMSVFSWKDSRPRKLSVRYMTQIPSEHTLPLNEFD